MQLWIGVYLPHLSLEVFRPSWSAEHHEGLSVLEGDRVIAMNLYARNAGVRIGMRRAGVLSLLPDVDFRERDLALETAAVNGLALALMQYSPQLSVQADATILIDVSASLRLFGGIRALRRRMRTTIDTCGFTARLCLAPTGTGVGLLAQAGIRSALRTESTDRQGRLRRASLESHVSRLPLLALPSARPFNDWFRGLGCKTLGDLRKLPRAGLKRRCGEDVLDTLDRALGHTTEWFEWRVLPDHFDVRQELPERVEQTQAVFACAAALLAQLTGWLGARQWAVTRIALRLEHERGRQAIPPTEIMIALSEPTWQDRHLLRLITERLARTVLDAPVIAVCLEACAVEAASPPSDSLFTEPSGNAGSHHRLLELLSARLGSESVSHCAALADHRPELANRWDAAPIAHRAPRAAKATATSLSTSASHTSSLPLDEQGPPRPAWLLAKPIPLMTRQHRPFYGSPLRIVSPAERIETGWWDGDPAIRDYFVAQASDHSCYWIYRERLNNRDEEHERWYLHGLFG